MTSRSETLRGGATPRGRGTSRGGGMLRALVLLAGACALAACSASGGPDATLATAAPVPEDDASSELHPQAHNAPGELFALGPAPGPVGLTRMINRALVEVSAKRALAVKQPVRGELIDRPRARVLIQQSIERNVPRETMLAQGELLRALGMVPPEYDFIEEMYRFANGEITGLYDPHHKAMYMLRDVPAVVAENALYHELAHALQDQHFDLDRRLKHVSHSHGDGASAQHCVAEGGATSVAFLVQQGQVPDAGEMREHMLEQMSGLSHVPALVRESLVTPYTDGLAFVEALRAQGGWSAVDAAWQRPPRSTEQLLHPDKYRADEAPLSVSVPAAPGSGWRLFKDDVLGEQGLRLVFTQWGERDAAREAAAGWGGDRYAVFERQPQPDTRDFWVAHRLLFDSEQDAQQAHALIGKAHPSACRERATVGPLAHARDGQQLVMVAGPYRMKGGRAQPIQGQSCAQAQRWLKQVLKGSGAAAGGSTGAVTKGHNGG